MIIVNVEVLMLNKNMDFQLDEDVAAYELRDAIVENIDRSMTARINRESGTFLLWHAHNGRMLNLNATGTENGLKTGSMLILA